MQLRCYCLSLQRVQNRFRPPRKSFTSRKRLFRNKSQTFPIEATRIWTYDVYRKNSGREAELDRLDCNCQIV